MLPLLLTRFAQVTDCNADKNASLFGILPKWFKYLPKDTYKFEKITQHCEINLDITGKPEQLWLVGLGIIDILIRIAGLVAVGYVIYGGYRYMSSQGDPENTKAALHSIINALVGLAITVVAAAFVSFIGGRFN